MLLDAAKHASNSILQRHPVPAAPAQACCTWLGYQWVATCGRQEDTLETKFLRGPAMLQLLAAFGLDPVPSSSSNILSFARATVAYYNVHRGVTNADRLSMMVGVVLLLTW